MQERFGEDVSILSNDPDVLQGQTIFAGTRVPLEILFGYRSEGGTLEEFLANYPSVGRWQATAAWQWGDRRLRQLIEMGDPERNDG